MRCIDLQSSPFYFNAAFCDYPYPENGSEGKSLNVFLTWKVHPGIFHQATFTVYLEANNPTPEVIVAGDLTSLSLDPETFDENKQYYYRDASERW